MKHVGFAASERIWEAEKAIARRDQKASGQFHWMWQKAEPKFWLIKRRMILIKNSKFFKCSRWQYWHERPYPSLVFPFFPVSQLIFQFWVSKNDAVKVVKFWLHHFSRCRSNDNQLSFARLKMRWAEPPLMKEGQDAGLARADHGPRRNASLETASDVRTNSDSRN